MKLPVQLYSWEKNENELQYVLLGVHVEVISGTNSNWSNCNNCDFRNLNCEKLYCNSNEVLRLPGLRGSVYFDRII
jgi:hypothetical protein